MSTPVVLASFNYRHEAEIAQGLLEDREIPSVLEVDDAGGMYAGLSFSNPARLRVRPEDLPQARAALIEAGVIPEEDRVEGEEQSDWE